MTDEELDELLRRLADDMIEKGPVKWTQFERDVGEKMRLLMEQNVKLINENRILAKKLLGR